MKLMLKWPNLHYSTSAFAPKHYPKAIIDYANTRGADKIIYAGYFPMGLSLERIMTEMDAVPFKDDVWPKFLHENAARGARRSEHELGRGRAPGGSCEDGGVTEPTRTTVFLLDDHEIVRRGLRDLLKPSDDMEVVGEAGTAEEALGRIPRRRPRRGGARRAAARRQRRRGVPRDPHPATPSIHA